MHAMYELIQCGLVLAVHCIAEGGVAVALAEMSFKNLIGVNIHLPGDLALDKKLFTESGGFILEVVREHLRELRKILLNYQVSMIILGETTTIPRLCMHEVIDLPISEAKDAWENGLRERLL